MGSKPSPRHTRSKRISAVGPSFFLLAEFMLRDVLLPTRSTDTHVGVAIGLEWLVFLVLVAFWIPRVEGDNLRGIGWDSSDSDTCGPDCWRIWCCCPSSPALASSSRQLVLRESEAYSQR